MEIDTHTPHAQSEFPLIRFVSTILSVVFFTGGFERPNMEPHYVTGRAVQSDWGKKTLQPIAFL